LSRFYFAGQAENAGLLLFSTTFLYLDKKGRKLRELPFEISFLVEQAILAGKSMGQSTHSLFIFPTSYALHNSFSMPCCWAH